MNILNTILVKKKPRSLFDLSHRKTMSHQAGRLYPSMVMEVLPGDKLKIDHQILSRCIPLVSPLMHEVDVTVHTYFVPTRIVWADFYKWMVGDLESLPPYIAKLEEEDVQSVNSLGNYMGLPLNMPVDTKYSAIPFACYAKIWNEYYRPQQFVDEYNTNLIAGDNTLEELYSGHTWKDFVNDRCLQRAWEHDYFTAALPEPQAGDPVTLPLTNAPVKVELTEDLNSFPQNIVNSGMGLVDGPLSSEIGSFSVTEAPNPPQQAFLDPNGSFEVDLNPDAVTINTFRRAQRVQMWLEQLARAGKRATEYLQVSWGVKAQDSRLQRPEFIGGTRGSLVISEVLSSAQTQTGDSVTPVGQLAGHGISLNGGNSFQYYAQEHGYIISMMSIRPRTQYMQGLHKSFRRFDRFDYADPIFGNLGEQEVKLAELWAQGTVNELDETFGYIPRYAEYKIHPSTVAGTMQTTEAYWHWARQFDNKPQLNDEFIACTPRTDIFAFTDPDIDQFQSMIYNNVKVIRKLPKYGIPHL